MLNTVSSEPVQMDIHRILHLLPHRYPFLLVDRVLECRAWESIRAVKNVSINLGFKEPLAPKIYAGSDMFLMPSRYEPCGLSQLIALSYGTVPIVRRTGGLADTVLDVTGNPREGNGFSFGDFNGESCWDAIQRALAAYRDREGWRKIMRRGMLRDVSWRHAADKYEELYRQCVEKKRG